jgi:pyruvate/2-oxoglutarate dehydrogenase complex dihydrolipoamide dehydrogenase (E3) component
VTAVEHFDIHVFGGGNAGKTLAMDQAKVGWHVAVIETGMIGGSCINIACIPSKALIFSAVADNGASRDCARLEYYFWCTKK